MSTIKFLDLTYRKECTDRAVKKVNSIINDDQITCSDLKTISQLNTYGYVKLDSFILEEEATEIKNYFETQSGYNSHCYVNSNKVRLDAAKRHECPVFCYSSKTILKSPYILQKAMDKNILALAQEYFGCLPSIYSFGTWWYTAQNNQTYCTQRNHRDHETYKALTLFVYLTDVTEQNSPHVFYPKTHNQFSEADKYFLETSVKNNAAAWENIPLENKESIKIIGSAGTAILADTFGIHRADPIINGNRLVLWIRYGCYLGSPNYQDTEEAKFLSLEDLFPTGNHNLATEHLFSKYLKNYSYQYNSLISSAN